MALAALFCSDDFAWMNGKQLHRMGFINRRRSNDRIHSTHDTKRKKSRKRCHVIRRFDITAVVSTVMPCSRLACLALRRSEMTIRTPSTSNALLRWALTATCQWMGWVKSGDSHTATFSAYFALFYNALFIFDDPYRANYFQFCSFP